MSKVTPQKSRSKAKTKTKRAKAKHTPPDILWSKQTLLKDFAANKNNTGYAFWVAHGLNYLASDYDNGIWEPLFPEIYNKTEIPTEVVHSRVMARFLDKDGHLSDTGIKCVLWVSLKTQEMYQMVQKVRTYTRAHKSECHTECEPNTWTFMQLLGNLMRKLCHNWEAFHAQAWDYESLFNGITKEAMKDKSIAASALKDTHSSRGRSPSP